MVSAPLTDPERLRAGLDEMMEQERSGSGCGPEREAKAWLERLVEADRMHAGYQELAAKGSMIAHTYTTPQYVVLTRRSEALPEVYDAIITFRAGVRRPWSPTRSGRRRCIGLG
jgi:hypothetical protein